MNSDKELDENIEKLKKERDLLLLESEIKKLKKSEERSAYAKKLFKKILSFIVFFLAFAGVIYIFSGLLLVKGLDRLPIIFFGLVLFVPLLLMLFIKGRSRS